MSESASRQLSEARGDQVGRVLSGRYRLITLIGVGASGEVYLADDTQLRRQVAVKVLHRALADDEVFLRRFRAEAQMAASLSHPNIVAVHDWGQDEVPYLVTEYLGGGSLRSMLDQHGCLSLSQTLLVALEVARGLEYAHRRGVVQRDIKPGNILFDSDGHVRIADFGLAKALAEASATEPSGAVLGTVRYASPEQAQGQRVDARSDVYSLGLVMFEAITGELPYDSDTTIGTLMARVDRPVELDERFGPLRGPVERATRIEPDQRPDAGELVTSLMAAAEDLPRPEPLPLVGAISFDPSSVMTGDTTLVGVATAPEAPAEPTRRRGLRRRGTDGPAARAAPAPERTRRRRWPWLVLMVLLVAGAGIGTYLAQNASGVPTQLVPEARGMTPEQLREQVGDFWQLEEAFDREDGSTPGLILRTDPPVSTELERGQVLTYFVSQGNALKTVPTNLVGLTLADAELFLQGAGLTLGEVERRHDEQAPEGTVIEVAETRVQIPGGDPVDLVVSSGPAPRTVPAGLEGLSYEEADSQLALDRLRSARDDAYSDTVAEGVVISVDPPAGTELERDSVVTLTVSLGPEPVAVPNVAGDDVLTASARIEQAGLCVGETDGPANTPVIATDPPAGTVVFVGTCVRIITSEVLSGG